jgi:hypothetical protein
MPVVELLSAKEKDQKIRCGTGRVSHMRDFVLWLVGGASHNESMNA